MTDPIDDVEDVTDADVAAAEQEAREAEELVASLEQRVENGDDTVSVDDIVEQEKLGRFARLRLTATRNKAERARVKRRLVAARTLRDEILADSSDIGSTLEKHLRAVAKAEAAFIAAAEEHNAKVAQWRNRAHELDIPATTGAPIPPEADGQLSIGTNGMWALNAAGLRVSTIDTAAEMERHRRAMSRSDKVSPQAVEERDRQYRSLRGLDAKLIEDEGQQFWRSRLTGVVITLDRAPSEHEIAAGQLEQVSRAEAFQR